MSLLDLPHDSWENEDLLVKIGFRALDLWLDKSCGPIYPNVASRPQAPKSIFFFFFFWDFIILLDCSHNSWENEVLLVKIGTKVLDLWLDKFCGPNWLKCSSQAPVLKVKFFWEFMSLLDLPHDSWENEVLFVNIGARVLDLWLGTSCRPIGPKVASKPHAPRLRNVLRFHNFIGFVSPLKWGSICEYWSQGSGHMAG